MNHPRVVLVTGCLGFLAYPLVKKLLAAGHYVYGLDAETYAANLDHREEFRGHPRFKYQQGRVEVLDRLPDVDTVFHLAAETHVCNSTEDATAFVQTNVLGTHRLLDLVARRRLYERPLVVHISTDEVYGDAYLDAATPATPLVPGNPYAASKAGADHLVHAYGRTHGLRYIIMRPSNCYGLGQFPEKLIPRAIKNLTLGKPIPVHGDGTQRRSWLHVEDCADAILTAWRKGTPGAIYNIGGEEASVAQVVHAIAGAEGAISMGHERKGQDARYAVDDSALRALGWKPAMRLWDALPRIVEAERQAFRW